MAATASDRPASRSSRPASEAPIHESDASGLRHRIPTRLKFEDGPNGALSAVEFEAPPEPTILREICEVLDSRRVSIVDSATRITARALFQRFQLSEADGSDLRGTRRIEVEQVFVEALKEQD
jgi:hypothetical protein